MSLKEDALAIGLAAVQNALPYENTKNLLNKLKIDGFPTVIALGKAAVPMAKAAQDTLGSRIKTGLLITKYGHTGDFSSSRFSVLEAAHPVSDDHSVLAAERAMALAKSLGEGDTLLCLLSGGGSALMEKSKVPPAFQRELTQKLLSRGADIEEINAVRRRLSLVKGGRLASLSYPAKVITVALSDVLSNDVCAIASGPTVPDRTDDARLREILDRYLSDVPASSLSCLFEKEPLKINDGGYYFAGDVNLLCAGALAKAELLGYTPHLMHTALTGEAREAAVKILDEIPPLSGRHAYIYTGETTVTLKGTGKGGRNQEMALRAAIKLRGRRKIAFLAMGSDGTDGPTSAAGGIVCGRTYEKMTAAGVSPEAELENNNSYFALHSAGALIFTGATGTNVNDLTLVLTNS